MTETPFCGIRVLTLPGEVMSPRTATEGLVDAAAQRIGARPALVADVGTGSGAIAVALALRGDGRGPSRRLVKMCSRALRPDGALVLQFHRRVLVAEATQLSELRLAA
jgi:hypothetical protein